MVQKILAVLTHKIFDVNDVKSFLDNKTWCVGRYISKYRLYCAPTGEEHI